MLSNALAISYTFVCVHAYNCLSINSPHVYVSLGVNVCSSRDFFSVSRHVLHTSTLTLNIDGAYETKLEFSVSHRCKCELEALTF